VGLERAQLLLTEIRKPIFLISWLTRVGMAVGVIFLMTVKPGAVEAVLAMLIATAVGAALGMILSGVRQAPQVA
jgi:hypothetical protein